MREGARERDCGRTPLCSVRPRFVVRVFCVCVCEQEGLELAPLAVADDATSGADADATNGGVEMAEADEEGKEGDAEVALSLSSSFILSFAQSMTQ